MYNAHDVESGEFITEDGRARVLIFQSQFVADISVSYSICRLSLVFIMKCCGSIDLP